jgi:hypothetical protein
MLFELSEGDCGREGATLVGSANGEAWQVRQTTLI